jgi:hypothetical protein
VGLPGNAETHWKFLTKDEAQWMIDRVERDRADSELEPFNLKVYVANMKDSKVWTSGCCLWESIRLEKSNVLPI